MSPSARALGNDLRADLARARHPLAALLAFDLAAAALVAVGPFAPVHGAWSTHPDGDAPLFAPASRGLAELAVRLYERPTEMLAGPALVAVVLAAALHVPLLAVLVAARAPGTPPRARESFAAALDRLPASLALGLAARILDALLLAGAGRWTSGVLAAHDAAPSAALLALAPVVLPAAVGLGLVRLVEDAGRAALGRAPDLRAALAAAQTTLRRRPARLAAWTFGGRAAGLGLGALAFAMPLAEARGPGLAATLAVLGAALAGRALLRAVTLLGVARLVEGVLDDDPGP